MRCLFAFQPPCLLVFTAAIAAAIAPPTMPAAMPPCLFFIACHYCCSRLRRRCFRHISCPRPPPPLYHAYLPLLCRPTRSVIAIMLLCQIYYFTLISPLPDVFILLAHDSLISLPAFARLITVIHYRHLPDTDS